MFNPKKADGIHASAARAEADMSSWRPSSTSAHSVVDACLTMRGDLESEGDILVKGKVIGNIRCKLLIIEVDALVEGGVEAEEVVVRGNSKGTLQADRVRLEKTANVESEIYHRSFAAEEGARIKGTLQYKDEPRERRANKECAGTKVVSPSKGPALNGHVESIDGGAA
jgi:cytoskeletal protein CcmA (bactofilin family)